MACKSAGSHANEMSGPRFHLHTMQKFLYPPTVVYADVIHLLYALSSHMLQPRALHASACS